MTKVLGGYIHFNSLFLNLEMIFMNPFIKIRTNSKVLKILKKVKTMSKK